MGKPKAAPSFRFYPDDFLVGTAFLSNEAVGGYVRLLCHQWDKGPLEKGRARSILGEISDKNFEEILEKFSEKDGKIFNKRLEVERRKQVEFKQKQKKNGQLGGRPGIPRPNPTGNPNKTQRVTQTITQKKPSDSVSERKKNKNSSSFVSVSDSAAVSDSSFKKTNYTAGAVQQLTPAGGKSNLTWEAYKTAYEARYQHQPLRNAKVNSLLAKLVEYLGREEAPLVAAFYLTHNHPLYVSNLHPITLLVRDYQKLHTEWKMGRKMTTGLSRQAEKPDEFRNTLDAVMARLEAKEQEAPDVNKTGTC